MSYRYVGRQSGTPYSQRFIPLHPASCKTYAARSVYTSVYRRCVGRNCKQGSVKMIIRHSAYANFKSLYVTNDTAWCEIYSKR
jgi:hypothetical protein